MQTLVIGLDAACREVIDPLISNGDIPNISSIYEQGVVSPLESQVPPWTASAWPSLYTGKNPGKHGVYDFLTYDGYDWGLVNAEHVRQPSLWEYLDHHDLSSVVLNVPVTHPPREFDGALIPGYLAPTELSGHPDGIIDDIRDEIGEYRLYAERETDSSRDAETKYNDYLDLTKMRGDAFRYLIDRFDPAFGFIQFQKTDAVFHDFPGDTEKVEGIYREVDKQIGHILDQTDPDLTLVVSDHGIGEYQGYDFHVNEYLRRGGFLESETGGRGVPSWVQMKEEELIEDEPNSTRSALTTLANFASSVGLTHQRGKYLLDKLGLTDIVRRRLPIGVVYAATEAVDYEESVAYFRSPSELGVRLNLQGREPSGVVDPDEYRDVRSEIINYLKEARTPDDEPVFERVAPRKEFFNGDYAEDAPDIVLVPKDYTHSLSGLLGELFSTPEPNNHKPTGILMACGPQIDQEENIGKPHIYDVAPTVLSSFSVAPAVDMDGSTIPFLEEQEPKKYPEYDGAQSGRVRDSDVEDRLSDLGYLE